LDVLIIGAGIIGLALARQLARRGQRVLVLDRPRPGRATSWAASGILPPPASQATHDPVEQLRVASHRLYPPLAEELAEETGIDVELRRSGGLYLARRPGEAVSLRLTVEQLRRDGVEVRDLAPEDVGRLEPGLARDAPRGVLAACFLPDEYRIRPPRLLQALEKSCRARETQLCRTAADPELRLSDGTVRDVRVDGTPLRARQYCLAAGAWTAALLERLNWQVPIQPWRGQIVMWKSAAPLISVVVNEGLRYLVPREDGHLLAGSTVEDVGFDCRTTDEALAELRRFAEGLLPALETEPIVKSWAGLRPGTPDGRPYLGRVPGIDNLFVAAGHFRSGIHLAPATADVMTQLILGEQVDVDLEPFRLNR
jgi:glycine oxidase